MRQKREEKIARAQMGCVIGRMTLQRCPCSKSLESVSSVNLLDDMAKGN